MIDNNHKISTLKKLIFAILFLVLVTHRHEDYCSNRHIHVVPAGTIENPYTFGTSNFNNLYRQKSGDTNSRSRIELDKTDQVKSD